MSGRRSLVDTVSSGNANPTNGPSAPYWQLWRSPIKRLRSLIRHALPFAAGMASALAALLLYNVVFPGPPPITMDQVDETVADAIASVTPAPAYSAQVYQA